jgi:hypothetical protein
MDIGEAAHVPTHCGPIAALDLSAALAIPHKASPRRAAHPKRILRFIVVPSIEESGSPIEKESPLHDKAGLATQRFATSIMTRRPRIAIG